MRISKKLSYTDRISNWQFNYYCQICTASFVPPSFHYGICAILKKPIFFVKSIELSALYSTSIYNQYGSKKHNSIKIGICDDALR